MDPFAAKPSLILFCDIFEPSERPALCPRPAQHRQEGAWPTWKSSGIGDTVMVGAEAEFFVFDSIRFGIGPNFGNV